MSPQEIAKLQAYLRSTLGSDSLICKAGAKQEMVEVMVNDEFFGTIYRDEEDGEVSYDFNVAILQADIDP